MIVKVFMSISIVAVLAVMAVAGIMLNRREYKSNRANIAFAAGDFTAGYVCIYSLLLVAAGFIISKAILFS